MLTQSEFRNQERHSHQGYEIYSELGHLSSSLNPSPNPNTYSFLGVTSKN